ncbi:MAG TPA: HAD family hydrolase [Candidatus Sulfomarinibacteraceae bacterium]|nr:HAD family hydrolase [Candidatus Sulfomarinibacteraceae bacterium]
MTGRSGPLAGIELAVFDKDGTLIEFDWMWGGWVRALADRMAEAHEGARLDDLLHDVLGVDVESGRVLPHGPLAATPMRRLRSLLVDTLAATGLAPREAERIVAAAWHAPDPVALARPITDLRVLFGGLRAAGIRIAVATSDDREPTERTLAHLGIDGLVEAVACADDGRPVKPNPDAVHWICGLLGVPEARAAVIGDSPADLAMGRAAGAGLTIGVLTGVGDHASLGALADVIVESVADLLPLA